jgi:Fe-Mn family superoxide dismutase
MIYTLPPLPYATDALEPKMSQETIEYHYGKHAQAYADKLTDLTAYTQFDGMTLEDLILKADGAIFNNAAQVWNHIFFFNSLTPEAVSMPKDLLHVKPCRPSWNAESMLRAVRTSSPGRYVLSTTRKS